MNQTIFVTVYLSYDSKSGLTTGRITDLSLNIKLAGILMPTDLDLRGSHREPGKITVGHSVKPLVLTLSIVSWFDMWY